MTGREEQEQLFLEKITQDSNGDEHSFSSKYCRKKQRTLNSLKKARKLRRLRPVILVAATLALMICVVSASVVFHAPGFSGIRSDNMTQIFADNTDNAPEKLEKLYAIDVPEGFSLHDAITDQFETHMVFMDENENLFSWEQSIKKNFNNYYITDNKFERCTVGEYPGVISRSDDLTVLTWDIGDYIMSIFAMLPEEDVMRPALSLHEITEFSWNTMLFDAELNDELYNAYTVAPDGYSTQTTVSGNISETVLSGENSATLRQYDRSSWENWTFAESEFVLSRNELHGNPAWLIRSDFGDHTIYSVLWEFDGYVFETTMNIIPTVNENGMIEVDLQVDEVLTLAGKILDCLEMEKG